VITIKYSSCLVLDVVQATSFFSGQTCPPCSLFGLFSRLHTPVAMCSQSTLFSYRMYNAATSIALSIPMIPTRDTTPMIPDSFMHFETRLRLLLLLLVLFLERFTYSLFFAFGRGLGLFPPSVMYSLLIVIVWFPSLWSRRHVAFQPNSHARGGPMRQPQRVVSQNVHR